LERALEKGLEENQGSEQKERKNQKEKDPTPLCLLSPFPALSCHGGSIVSNFLFFLNEIDEEGSPQRTQRGSAATKNH
jgi:hypothetical protein